MNYKSDFAQNFFRLFVTLKCDMDIQEVYTLTDDSVYLGTYGSTNGKASPIKIPLNKIWKWSYALCEPKFDILDVKGYLRIYCMVSLS